jgi:hypothetical protein
MLDLRDSENSRCNRASKPRSHPACAYEAWLPSDSTMRARPDGTPPHLRHARLLTGHRRNRTMRTDKPHAIAAAAAACALFALGAGVQAQTTQEQVLPVESGNAIIIVTPPDDSTGAPGSTAVFTPLDNAANAPPSRAEVKAEARQAVQSGEQPRGELGPADATDHGQLPEGTSDLRHRP